MHHSGPSMRTLLYRMRILIDINYDNFMVTGALGENSEIWNQWAQNMMNRSKLPPGVRTLAIGRPDARPQQATPRYCLLAFGRQTLGVWTLDPDGVRLLTRFEVIFGRKFIKSEPNSFLGHSHLERRTESRFRRIGKNANEEFVKNFSSISLHEQLTLHIRIVIKP